MRRPWLFLRLVLKRSEPFVHALAGLHVLLLLRLFRLRVLGKLVGIHVLFFGGFPACACVHAHVPGGCGGAVPLPANTRDATGEPAEKTGQLSISFVRATGAMARRGLSSLLQPCF